MKYEITIDGKPALLTLDGERFQYQRGTGEHVERNYSAAPVALGTWSVLIQGRSYTAIVLPSGEVSVNGRVSRVEVLDPRGMRGRNNTASSGGRQTIIAPMPGKVIRVLVEVGQGVEAGQGLIVVEAMKMQNEMKSPRIGRVVELKTTAGATVSAGEILAVVE